MLKNKNLILYKVYIVLLTLVLICMSFALCTEYSFAENGSPSLVTTLKDNFEQKGSRRTFDVFAKDSEGNKIDPSNIKCTLNGEKVPMNWNDSTKTSYTLNFSNLESGTYPIEIKIVDGENVLIENTFTVRYIKANKGDFIGYITLDVEASTISRGFIVEPINVPIHEGENAANVLIKVLHDKGFGVDYTGSPDNGFYMSRIIGKGGELGVDGVTPTESLKLINLAYEKSIEHYLIDNFGEFDADNGSEESLGEFDYTYGSGWMYCMNNIFPNVGFADSWPSDGDVIRTQFTLAYGGDIGGGMPGMSHSMKPLSNKDKLIKAMADLNMIKGSINNKILEDYYTEAISIINSIGASQSDVDKHTEVLQIAIGDANEAISFSNKILEASDPNGITDSVAKELIEQYNNLNKQSKSMLSDEVKNKINLIKERINDSTLTNVVTKGENDSSVIADGNKVIYTKGVSTKAVYKIEGVDLKAGDLQDVILDGKSVDKSYYEVRNGSIIVTFKKNYVDSLSTGAHKITFKTSKGDAEAELVVKQQDSAGSEPGQKDDASKGGKTTVEKDNVKAKGTTKTGDNANALGYAGLTIAALGVGYAVARRRKNLR